MAQIENEKIQALIRELLGVANEFMLVDRGKERLGDTLRDMLELAAKFCAEGMWIQAERICDMGRDISKITHEYRGAEMDPSFALGAVHYYYGVALVGQQDISKALEYFNLSCDAFKLTANFNMSAAAVWLGVAELHSHQENYNETLWALQRSRNLIQARPGHSADELRRRIEREQSHARSRLDEHLRKPSSPESGKTAPRSLHTIALRAIPVHQDLAAGSCVWHSDNPYAENYVEWQRLWIDSHSYVIVPLEGVSQLTMTSNYDYGVSNVRGNSMNKTKIQDGDYILYRRPRGGMPKPNHGEIVVASLDAGVGREGVVKRYKESYGEAPILASESTDLQERDIPLIGVQADFVGQVVAVLKRAEENEL